MKALPLVLGRDFIPHPEYRFVTTVTVMVPLCMGITGRFEFWDGKRLLGVLEDDMLTIYAGYAWDGNSPAFCSFGRWWSPTPTLKCGYGPSLVHDFTRQFMRVNGCPWSREQTDTLFYNLIVAGGSNCFAGLYHYAVAGPIGTVFIAATYKANPDLHIEIL